MDETQAQLTTEQPVVSSSPATPTSTVDPVSWGYFFMFCILSFLFWIAELIYQYFTLPPEQQDHVFVTGSALTGITLIAAALFSSAVFKWFPRYARFWRARRYLGASGTLIISVHVVFAIIVHFDGSITDAFYSFNPILNPVIFGAIAYVILFAMLLTSTDWAMQVMGTWWKFLHRFVYAAFAAAILHGYFMNPQPLFTPPGYLAIALTGLAVFGQLYWFFKTIARKHFRSLGTIVGFSIIIFFLVFLWLGLARQAEIDKQFRDAQNTSQQ